MDGYLLVLIILLAYFAVLILGHRLKLWEKLHLTVYGPFLMLKTRRGKNLLDWLARPTRYWTFYGKISIWICVGSMLFLMLLLLWEAFLVLDLPSTAAPPPEMMIGLPGINPVIPLWYGIFGIAVAIIVHEFAHGVLARVAKIKVESMGLLFLIFPMGAFVEPNEDEIKKTTPKHRTRMFAAGPATNMILAFITILLLVMVVAPAAKPVTDGAIVVTSISDSPAEVFGLETWSEIVEVDGEDINSASDLSNITFPDPGDPVNVRIFYKGQYSEIELPAGIAVKPVGGLPAHNAGIREGMIIHSINDTVITGLDQFRSVIENETPDVPLNLTVLSYKYDPALGKNWFVENENITSIILTTKYNYYYTYSPNENKLEYKNISYMGVTSAIFGVGAQDADFVKNVYAQPFANVDEPGEAFTSFLRLIAMPFLGYTPVESPMADLYVPDGALSFLGTDGYWILVNCIYWVFWINLMLGLTNALPAVPLDGGYIFKDLVKEGIKKIRRTPLGIDGLVRGRKPMTEDQLDRAIGTLTILASLFVLFLILWQLIGPRLGL